MVSRRCYLSEQADVWKRVLRLTRDLRFATTLRAHTGGQADQCHTVEVNSPVAPGDSRSVRMSDFQETIIQYGEVLPSTFRPQLR